MKALSLWLTVLTSGGLFAVGACSSGELSLDDYDTSCTVDGDCQPVYIGDVCNCGAGCPNTAINQSDFGQYREDLADALDACGEVHDCLPAPCLEVQGVCGGGQCQLETTSTGGGGFGGSGNAGGTAGSGNTGGSGNMGGAGGQSAGGGGAGGASSGGSGGS